MEFVPGVREIPQTKFCPDNVPGAPLQVRVEIPDTTSLLTPVRLMVAVLKPMVEPLAGDEMVRRGGVLSRLTVAEVLAEFPAKSVAVPPTICPPPSTATT
jgi:hypothetical protein